MGRKKEYYSFGSLCSIRYAKLSSRTMPTLRLIIKGKVQGVFYRASAKEIADELGVTGLIQNITGGDVEAMVTGSKKQLELFEAWCRQGPPGANVSEVISTEQDETIFEDFKVIR